MLIKYLYLQSWSHQRGGGVFSFHMKFATVLMANLISSSSLCIIFKIPFKLHWHLIAQNSRQSRIWKIFNIYCKHWKYNWLKTVLQNWEILSTNRIMCPSGSTMSTHGLVLIRYHCMHVCLVHSTHHRHLIKSTQGIIEILSHMQGTTPSQSGIH